MRLENLLFAPKSKMKEKNKNQINLHLNAKHRLFDWFMLTRGVRHNLTVQIDRGFEILGTKDITRLNGLHLTPFNGTRYERVWFGQAGLTKTNDPLT